jgi:hypothetical protein
MTGRPTDWHDLAPVQSLESELSAKLVKHLQYFEVINRSEYFDTDYYLREYPDVLESKIHPVSHYLAYGANEFRNPSAFLLRAMNLEPR